MEVDAAVGVASMVIQVCDFSLKVYSKYRDQQAQVSQLADVELEKELAELNKCADHLQKQPNIHVEGSNPIIDQYQQDLRDAAVSTAAAVRQLSVSLEALKPQPGQSRVESLISAGRSVLKAKKLQQLKEEVDRCRARTQFIYISLLSEKQDLSIAQQLELLGNQKESFDLAQKIRAEVLSALTVHHNDIRTLVLEMKDGSTKTMETTIGTSNEAFEAPILSSSVTSVQDVTADGSEVTTTDFKRILSRVADRLSFKRLTERQHIIKEAHFATFNWIFEEHIPVDKAESFSSFPRWLSCGHGCYWIQGKAGSGKSTLVKRIHDHEKTHEHLQQWAGDRQLLTASFFFWYLGTGLQKSIEGMLRSLLFALLEQAPRLVLNSFPWLFIEAARSGSTGTLPEPTLGQLSAGFDRLFEACEASQAYTICFFIDGLDECFTAGKTELADLAKFLLDLGKRTQTVKFVLSSRPLAEFADTFSSLPGLQVQDLTKTDIEDYARELIPHDRYAIGRDDLEALIITISERSQGVFLWVTVVVQTVLEGLRNGDTANELQARVERLPAELKHLYRRMLGDVDENYRQQAAEMLLLTAVAFDPMHPTTTWPLIDPFPAIQLSFALDGCAAAMLAPIEHFPEGRVQDRIESLKLRLRSRCLGLLELRDKTRDYQTVDGQPLPGKKLFSTCVQPFHRTAVEFLLDEEVYDFLTGLAGKDFDAFGALFCSTVRMAKIETSFTAKVAGTPAVDLAPWHHLPEVLCLVSDAVRRGSGVKQEYMDELDRVYSRQWASWARSHAAPPYHQSHWMSTFLGNKDTSQGNWHEKIKDHGNLSLDDDLYSQLLERCDRIGFLRIVSLVYRPDDIKSLLDIGSPLLEDDATVLLRFLLQTRFNPKGGGFLQLYFEHDTHLALRCLLGKGADPNARDTEDQTLTLFARFLTSIYDFMVMNKFMHFPDHGGLVLESMVEDFVSHGADLSVLVSWRGDPLPPSVYVYSLHLLAIEGQALYDQSEVTLSSLLLHRYTVLRHPLERASHFLRTAEERAGLHSPNRGFRKWLKTPSMLRKGSTGSQSDVGSSKSALSALKVRGRWTSRFDSRG